jgi:glycosyltransferase involved in cell wall biosynthesis
VIKRVLVIANNLEQASYRVRVEALIKPLAERSVELDVKLRPQSPLARRNLLRSATEYDAVLLQRKLLDPSDARLLRRSVRRIYYDVDDAVMYHAGPVGWWSQFRTTRRFHATAAIVDRVVAGNEYLADIFRARGCAVTVLPSVVDPGRYDVKRHKETESPRLVWIGSRSTLPYVREHLAALERASDDVGGLKLVTIADQTIEKSRLPIEHVPWSAAAEAASLVGGDIGIAPTPSDRWTLGKCGFKIVQYMAAGLPVVASPVGANAEIVQDGVTGYLPARMEDWPDAIARLAHDPNLRARLGRAGRERVEREYSITKAADVWAQILAD